MGGRGGGVLACALAGSAAGVACGAPLILDLPAGAPENASVIIAVESDTLEVYALPLSQARVLSVPRPGSERSLVTAMLFDPPLEALGLPQGALSPSAAPDAVLLPFDLASSVHTGTVSGSSFSGWAQAPRGAVSMRVLEFRFEGSARARPGQPPSCPAIGAPISIPLVDAVAPSPARSSNGSLGVLVALDERRALVGVTDGSVFYEIDRIDRTAKYLDSISKRFAVMSGFVAPGGAVYAVGAQFVRIERDLGSFMVLPRPLEIEPTEDLVALDGSREGSPFELYAVSELGTLFRYDGSAWELLVPQAPIPDPRDVRHRFRNVAWIGPGHAVMARNTESIFRYRRDGDPRLVEEQVEPGFAMSCVAHVSGWGTVAGGLRGTVYLEDEKHHWRLLFATDTFHLPDLLLPFGRGVFVAGGAGFAGVALAGETAPCTIDQRGTPGYITRAARVGPDLLIGGSVSSADQYGSLRVLPIE